MTDFEQRIGARLQQLEDQDLRRSLRSQVRSGGPRVRVGERELLSFASNDYLGLRDDPRVIAALKRAADRYGVGAGAAHLLGGHHPEHAELERELADWLGRPAVLLFSSGYQAALGVLGALLGRHDQVFQDRLNHACLLDGARLAGARLKRYPHLDLPALAAQLEACGSAAGRLVISDSVFSMDGDQAPLAELAALAEQHRAWLMLDEAHALGVLGPGGSGAAAQAGLDVTAAHILLGTLGKALGTFGAFISGSDELREFLINQARTWIYTTALPPAIAAATRESMRIARHEQWRRDRLQQLIARLRAGLDQLGLEALPSSTPIQPVLIGPAGTALAASRQLESAGLLVPAIRPPTVPQGSARLRISLSAAHTDSDVDQLLSGLAGLKSAPTHLRRRTPELYHQRFGGQGPCLVLLHGWGLHGAIFGPLIRELEQDHRVFVFDLPGHGHSRDPALQLDPEQVSAAIRAIVPQAHWFGWSLGGLLALHTALSTPQAVQSLLMCAAGPCFVERAHWPAGMPLQVFESFARDLAQDWEGTLERFLVLETLGAAEPMHELRLLKQLAFERGAPRLAGLQQGLDLLGGLDLSPRLAELQCPSWWIGGKRDRLVAPAALQAAVERSPRARLELIDKAGHAPFLTWPAAVARIVREAVAAAESA